MASNDDLSGSDLPTALLDWVAATIGGEVLRAERHTARREAWRIDTRGANGAEARYFLRIDRLLAHGRHYQRNLKRETALIRALGEHGIPAQKIIGWNDKYCVALQSWVPGRGELNKAEPALQQRVMLEFMDIVAKLHRIDINSLDLPEFIKPANALEHSLLEVAAVEEPELFPVSACAINPMAAFGKRWLINHAPQQVQATVLLHGDTGPANFMYDDSGVTALVDWEWGHYGDPMEDLGNIWLRDFFYPSAGGDLTPYFQRYAERSGFKLDYSTILYYRIHQVVRSVISLAYLTDRFDWQTPFSLNLGYRAVIDTETCRAIAEASGADFERLSSATVAVSESTDSLYQSLAMQMDKLITPNVGDAYAAAMSRGNVAVMRYLDRRERHGADCDAHELESLRKLLGSRFEDLTDARAALIRHIDTLPIDQEAPVLAHLSAVAANQAALMAPLIAPWQQCRWATVRVA
jgi:aminoglycoside phosphotransferase (APT) family kinase protein